MREIELAPLPEELGTRLDLFIASRLPQLTRSAAQRLIESGYVLCGGKALNKSHRITGQTVRVSLPDPAPDIAEPEDIPLSVVYEDDWLLVVDKPKGMVVLTGDDFLYSTIVSASRMGNETVDFDLITTEKGRIQSEDLEKLQEYHWPGNVRQLFQCLSRAEVCAQTEIIYPEHIQF